MVTCRRVVAGVLRQKDAEQALILEEKMVLQQKLLAAAGVDNMLECPNYSGLVAEDTESSVMWQEVLSAVQVNLSILFPSHNMVILKTCLPHFIPLFIDLSSCYICSCFLFSLSLSLLLSPST
jgi:hypothetical protein